jgi:hypothetical protein
MGKSGREEVVAELLAEEGAEEGILGGAGGVRGEGVEGFEEVAGTKIEGGTAEGGAGGEVGFQGMGVEGVEELGGSGGVAAENAGLGGGEELIGGGLGFGDGTEFAAGGGGAAEETAGDAAEEADARGTGLVELVLGEEQGVEGVEGFGGFAFAKEGFGEWANGVFRGRLIFMTAAEGGLPLPQGEARQRCGCGHCRIEPGKSQLHEPPVLGRMA